MYTYIYISRLLFLCVLWHINTYGCFNTKLYIYIYISFSIETPISVDMP